MYQQSEVCVAFELYANICGLFGLRACSCCSTYICIYAFTPAASALVVCFLIKLVCIHYSGFCYAGSIIYTLCTPLPTRSYKARYSKFYFVLGGRNQQDTWNFERFLHFAFCHQACKADNSGIHK